MAERRRVSAIRKDDTVKVMAGKEKGKTGRVLRILPKAGRVVVEKVNFIKRHTRPSQTSKGGIVEREAAISLSSVMPVCPKCNEPTRVGHAKSDEGIPVRVCRSCGQAWDVPPRPKAARKK